MLELLKLYLLPSLSRSEKGQDMAEYALLLGVVAIASVVAAVLLGNNLNGVFNHILGALAALFGG